MEGWVTNLDAQKQIVSFEQLQRSLDELFSVQSSWPERYESLQTLLGRVKIPSKELSKFVDWSCREMPYTRRLVGTDGLNYTLLVLSWNPGRESKIHNHPCQGCFVLPMSGALVETIFSMHPDTEEIREEFSTICKPGSMSFMNDEIGLHKIGNASRELGAVSLHLYTPPFSSCKVPGSFISIMKTVSMT